MSNICTWTYVGQTSLDGGKDTCVFHRVDFPNQTLQKIFYWLMLQNIIFYIIFFLITSIRWKRHVSLPSSWDVWPTYVGHISLVFSPQVFWNRFNTFLAFLDLALPYKGSFCSALCFLFLNFNIPHKLRNVWRWEGLYCLDNVRKTKTIFKAIFKIKPFPKIKNLPASVKPSSKKICAVQPEIVNLWSRYSELCIRFFDKRKRRITAEGKSIVLNCTNYNCTLPTYIFVKI